MSGYGTHHYHVNLRLESFICDLTLTFKMLVEFILFVCLVCLLYKLLWNKSKIDAIPGPRQVPWFGNALQVSGNILSLITNLKDMLIVMIVIKDL